MTLYLVATPIGNLEDFSRRAERILREVDVIAAEDTRHSKRLLDHYEIKTPMTSYHGHSSQAKIEALVRELAEGKNMALISDAGTPGISDPAYSLVQAALKAGVSVVPIPGASAVITALMASGLPTDKFVYLGFIPAKKGRETLFKSLVDEERTVVLYESPHRLLKTLEQMEKFLGPDRKIVLARELTKMHETFHRGTISELNAEFKKQAPRGEFVLLVAPKDF